MSSGARHARSRSCGLGVELRRLGGEVHERRYVVTAGGGSGEWRRISVESMSLRSALVTEAVPHQSHDCAVHMQSSLMVFSELAVVSVEVSVSEQSFSRVCIPKEAITTQLPLQAQAFTAPA